MNAVSFYNTTVAAGKMAVAASCIASTGSVGLVPIAASLAVFQGVELFAEAVSKYGADKLAARAAGRDPRKYESYFKTCKHFTDFVATLGVQSVAPKAVCKAEKQIFEYNKRCKKLEYPTNFNTALKHKVVLAFQEAGILSVDGTLTKHAIQEAKLVIPFARLENQVAKNAMMQIDRNGIWGKYYTKSIKISDGQSAEIHFYMESKTGKVYLGHDFKVKVNDNIGVGIYKPVKKRGGKK